VEGMRGRVRFDFYWRRLSVLGLARKYGRTVAQIENYLRGKR
jgi:hypothetical protein